MYFSQKFAQLLRLPIDANSRDMEKRVRQRLSGMGYREACPCCTGAGSRSKVQPVGRCYRCEGAGVVPHRLSDELYAKVQADITAGKLDTYLQQLRQRIEAKKRAAAKADEMGSGYLRSNRRRAIQAHAQVAAAA